MPGVSLSTARSLLFFLVEITEIYPILHIHCDKPAPDEMHCCRKAIFVRSIGKLYAVTARGPNHQKKLFLLGFFVAARFGG